MPAGPGGRRGLRARSDGASPLAGCCGLFCFPCLACTVAGDMNECCLCGTSVAMRTMYRTRYNIPVSGGLGGEAVSGGPMGPEP